MRHFNRITSSLRKWDMNISRISKTVTYKVKKKKKEKSHAYKWKFESRRQYIQNKLETKLKENEKEATLWCMLPVMAVVRILLKYKNANVCTEYVQLT